MTIEIMGVSHYHHRRISHPRPSDIQIGQIKVELMTGGRGWIIHRDDFREVLPGDLIWHIHGDRTVCRNDPDAPFSCLSVNFSVPPSDVRPVQRVTRWEDKSAVNNFIKELIHCYHDDQFNHQTLADYAYNRLLFMAQRWVQKRFEGNLPRPLKDFLSRVEHEFHHDINIESLAAAVNWSAAHLHDQCKIHFDETPLQIILRHRINYAKERLCSNRDSVKQIAGECGFNSSSHFCRSFKQHAGMSPEQFRRSNWAE